jgi:L-alanine-DL-glutamate epimerase-like enolase superfamily enzyme
VADTLRAVAFARERGGRIVLLEQPVPRGALDDLARLTREAGVPVAADEAVRSLADVERIGRERLASVINMKIAKSGVHRGFEMVRAARAHGLGTMIGAMVETRLGTGFSAHLVAGIGGFAVVDLDTPWLMTEDPIVGGPALDGPNWRIDPRVPGHGARLPVAGPDEVQLG